MGFMGHIFQQSIPAGVRRPCLISSSSIFDVGTVVIILIPTVNIYMSYRYPCAPSIVRCCLSCCRSVHSQILSGIPP